jgi:carboxyl-terminal processing protease
VTAPRRAVILVLGFASLASAAPNPIVRPVETPDQLLERAAVAEKAGEWEPALESYLRAYLAGRQTPEIRRKIAVCHRHTAQARRHRDPVFRQHILNLPTAEALNLYMEVLDKLTALHADRERATPSKLFLSGLEEFDRALANRAFRGDHFPGAADATIARFRRTIAEFWKSKPPATVREARAAALELSRSAGTELGLKTGSAVVLELLCGSCNGLDEYTIYLSPLHGGAETAGFAELAAYGIVASFRKGILTVDRITPESWGAENPILKIGDRIARINGRRITDSTTLVESLRFPIDGDHEFEIASDYSMMAMPVHLPTPLPTVQASILNMKDGIGYVKIAGFHEQTPLELDSALARLKEQGIRSLVLDLRGNAGGHFLAGVRVAERFVPTGIIATTEGQSPEFAGRVFSSDSGMLAFDLPMAVLIDTRTMSAAEIVASALKEQQRAIVIGMPTFGKGVVQHPFKLGAADTVGASGVVKVRSGTLVLTIAKVLTARGAALHGQGVLPDLVEADPARQLALALERLAPR